MNDQNGFEEALHNEVRDAILSELAQFRVHVNSKFDRFEEEVKEMFAAIMSVGEDQDG